MSAANAPISATQDTPSLLAQRFQAAVGKAVGDEHASANPQVRPANNPKFGDYQANLAMGLAKQLGQKPRDLAQKIVDALDVSGLCEKVEIAGPGFINLYLSEAFIDRQVAAMTSDADRLGVAPADPPRTVVVDYSGPNVAKEMHVGHLRSTVIGDCIARTLDFQGHRVIRQNHLGDWGTQFGMLIEHLIESVSPEKLASASFEIGDLNAFYQQAKKKFDQDTGFADRARARVVALQGGDKQTHKLWQALYNKSVEHFDAAYSRMGVLLTDDDIHGESFYNPKLPAVIEGLKKANTLKESQGAKVVFPDGFVDREGEPQPIIVQKSDGGYLYATTDLAAARYRIDELGADRVIYVTDARQSQHFAMVFATLRQVGWASQQVQLDHVPFGTVLGKDHKPFKTREGGTVKLIDLLDEAQRRAVEVVKQKNPDLSTDRCEQIAHAIGIGALKYADLSSDRIKDYVFDWDRMLSFEGNTAPYLQNAFVRIRSIFRKGEIAPGSLADAAIAIRQPTERALAVKLLQLPEVIEAVAQSLEPHRLCTYLYELASAFHQFYEKCSVLNAADEPTKHSRLALCELTARTLEKGLGLLGIGVVEQM